mgnify:CR=1 FL=1
MYAEPSIMEREFAKNITENSLPDTEKFSINIKEEFDM